jgi:undecaprenyl-diphosphatase
MKKHLQAIHALWAVLLLIAALLVRRTVLPRRPKQPPAHRTRRLSATEGRPLPTGKGLHLVVNTSAGPALAASPVERIREALPDAKIVELVEDLDLEAALTGPDVVAVGAAGGDGTLNAVASVALEHDALFVAIPAGTLNHFARDLGLDSVEDALDAVHDGSAVAVDVGTIGDRIFLNTFSFGGYTAVVDRREQWEGRIGKWPALLLALVVELPRMQPLPVLIDGHLERVWIAFVGNCRYAPAGLAPRWREALDDGLLDVRIVNGAKRGSRTRFAVAALTGRLRSSSVYREWTAERVEVASLEGPLRLAADGETFDGPGRFEIAKRPRALRVALARPAS